MAITDRQGGDIRDTLGKKFAVTAVVYAILSYLAGAATKDYSLAGWDVLPWVLGPATGLAALVALLLTQHTIDIALETEVFSRFEAAMGQYEYVWKRVLAFIVGLMAPALIIFWYGYNDLTASATLLWSILICIPLGLWAFGRNLYIFMFKGNNPRAILYALSVCAVLSVIGGPVSDKIADIEGRNERQQLCLAILLNPLDEAELQNKCTLYINAVTRKNFAD